MINTFQQRLANRREVSNPLTAYDMDFFERKKSVGRGAGCYSHQQAECTKAKLFELPASWNINDIPPFMFKKTKPNSQGFMNPRDRDIEQL